MKKTPVFHPFLFAIFPVLFLFAHNIALASPAQVVIPLTITILFTLLAFLFLSYVFKNKEKAGLVVSLFALLFFSYGHFYNLIEGSRLVIMGYVIGPNRALFLSGSLLFLLGMFFCIRTRRNLHNFTSLLNVIAASLVVISLINIGVYELKTGVIRKDDRGAENVRVSPIDSEKPAEFPNIYYIILDAYARADVLEEMYKYDNTEFIDYLTKRGFYVADKSRSNYCQSLLSLAASLNFEYLDGLADRIGIENDSRRPLINMIRNNRVFHFLKQYGYVTVAFDSSGWGPTQIRNADIFYITPGWGLNAFHNELINTTPIPIILEKLSKLGKRWLRRIVVMQYDFYRKKTLYAFDKLGSISKQEGPIFVFVHILAPHQPFVFGEHGEPIIPDEERFTMWHVPGTEKDRAEYIEDYKRQLSFINKKAQEAIDKMISNSPTPPIIILQADHGPASMLDCGDPDNTDLKERMTILNAYHLPDKGAYAHLYNTITPVNTFRVIFNYYFGADYKLLKDESYFSSWSHPYKFINVTDSINSGFNAE